MTFQILVHLYCLTVHGEFTDVYQGVFTDDDSGFIPDEKTVAVKRLKSNQDKHLQVCLILRE